MPKGSVRTSVTLLVQGEGREGESAPNPRACVNQWIQIS